MNDSVHPCDGCDNPNCIECEVPQIEPEECESCKAAAIEAGIEYEFNVTHKSGYWTCEHCGCAV